MKINVCKSECMELNAELQRTWTNAEKQTGEFSANLRALSVSALISIFGFPSDFN